ncbi:hypothetical protein, partial [Pseudonocardia sp.]|uniref:hypothetical protein n=1 Tax=Pseudonocardia sp. TaxID=60912 RepID=UPI0031FBAC5B
MCVGYRPVQAQTRLILEVVDRPDGTAMHQRATGEHVHSARDLVLVDDLLGYRGHVNALAGA